MKEEWALVYESGTGRMPFLYLLFAVVSLFGVVICFGNLLELVGEPWSEWTLITAYLLLVAGLAATALAFKTLKGVWKGLAAMISPVVVFQGALDHLRVEYYGKTPDVCARGKSATSYWNLTADGKTWKIPHNGTWQFDYRVRPGAEIRIKHPRGGGPDDLMELWVNKAASYPEASPEGQDEWVLVHGLQSIWKTLFASLLVLVLWLPCMSFLLVASVFGVFIWIANALQLAGLLVLPANLDWHLKRELMRAAGYEKALFGLKYLVGGAAFSAVAWMILKGLWRRLVATIRPPLSYEGPLDKLYEAPHSRYGLYWELTAGQHTWRIDGYTSGDKRSWFKYQVKPGKQIRAVYPQGDGIDIMELWVKQPVWDLGNPDEPEDADDLADAE